MDEKRVNKIEAAEIKSKRIRLPLDGPNPTVAHSEVLDLIDDWRRMREFVEYVATLDNGTGPIGSIGDRARHLLVHTPPQERTDDG